MPIFFSFHLSFVFPAFLYDEEVEPQKKKKTEPEPEPEPKKHVLVS